MFLPSTPRIARLALRGAEGAQLASALEARGYVESTQAAALLTEFRAGGTMRRLDAPGRARLDLLMPRLLAAIVDQSSQVDVLRRILRVLEAIGSRSAYFALLNENAQVRRKLVELAARGEFLAAQIASHPLLLDELLDESAGARPTPRAELEAEVGARLAHLAEDEPERHVEVLRQFQRAARLSRPPSGTSRRPEGLSAMSAMALMIRSPSGASPPTVRVKRSHSSR